MPGALPSILVGLRYALGVMWLTLIVAETIAANAGIGYVTMNAREFLQTDVLVFGILLYASSARGRISPPASWNAACSRGTRGTHGRRKTVTTARRK